MKNKKLPNNRFRSIDFLYAFVAIQKDGEGIMGMQSGGVMYPMIGADMAKVEEFRPIADQISKEIGVPYEIRKFKRC